MSDIIGRGTAERLGMPRCHIVEMRSKTSPCCMHSRSCRLLALHGVLPELVEALMSAGENVDCAVGQVSVDDRNVAD